MNLNFVTKKSNFLRIENLDENPLKLLTCPNFDIKSDEQIKQPFNYHSNEFDSADKNNFDNYMYRSNIQNIIPSKNQINLELSPNSHLLNLNKSEDSSLKKKFDFKKISGKLAKDFIKQLEFKRFYSLIKEVKLIYKYNIYIVENSKFLF